MAKVEIWMDIRGYSGEYQVSSFGNVRSLDRGSFVTQARYSAPRFTRRRGRQLRQSKDGKGYFMVMLCKAGKPKHFNVHRLVAQHFIDNPLNKPAVNHRDSNCLNNRVENLEWCTIRENNIHALRNKRKPSVYKSFFSAEDREVLNDLFDHGVGVTAISEQLSLPYSSVRYVYRMRINS